VILTHHKILKVNLNSNNFREMFWDESNRLRVVYDQNSYQIQHYIYDGAGERILKASSQIETVYENGQVDANIPDGSDMSRNG
jgi:hypothetical protein